MAFRRVVGEPSSWAAWVVLAGTYAAIVVADTLDRADSTLFADVVLLGMASIVPTVWPVRDRDGGSQRVAGGLGFVLGAGPIWSFSAGDVGAAHAAALMIWCFASVWCWSGIATAFFGSRTVALIAAFLVLVPAVHVTGSSGSAGVRVVDWTVLSSPVAYGLPQTVRWWHAAATCIIGAVAWALARESSALAALQRRCIFGR